MPFTGQFAVISNQSDWEQPVSFPDSETDELINISAATAIQFDICNPDNNSSALVTASLANGKIIVVDTTVAEINLTRTDLSNLCAGTYDCFLHVTIDGQREPVVIGTIAVSDGGPSS